jgi:hypothetical protein
MSICGDFHRARTEYKLSNEVFRASDLKTAKSLFQSDDQRIKCPLPPVIQTNIRISATAESTNAQETILKRDVNWQFATDGNVEGQGVPEESPQKGCRRKRTVSHKVEMQRAPERQSGALRQGRGLSARDQSSGLMRKSRRDKEM